MRSCITDEQFRQLHRRTDELMRRTTEGTISFVPTMRALQEIIESKREPAPVRERVLCDVRDGSHCTICAAYFADGDNICANGHQIGETY